MVGDNGLWRSEPWGSGRLLATQREVRRRAEITPGLTAVRFGGESATYGDLAEAFTGYDTVAERNGLGVGSSVVASILHCLPRIGTLGEPGAVAGATGQVVEWLARDIDDGYEQIGIVG
jgi:hypothetical protein